MTYPEVLANARECLSPNCRACPVCNGRACGNHIPGPGAKGVGDTAIRNYEKWQQIRVNMDTICPGGEPDTTLNLFGKTFLYPFFAYEKWQQIRVNMDTICPGGEPDPTLNLFGKTFLYPFFAGPVGAVTMHYSDKYDDTAYNDILVRACADSAIAAFTGDGVNPRRGAGSHPEPVRQNLPLSLLRRSCGCCHHALQRQI